MAAETRVRTVILHPHELTAAGLTHVLTQSRSPHFHVVSPEHPDPQPDIVLYNAEQRPGRLPRPTVARAAPPDPQHDHRDLPARTVA